MSDPSRPPHLQPLARLQRHSSSAGLDVDGTSALAPLPHTPGGPQPDRPIALALVPPLAAPTPTPVRVPPPVPPPPVNLVLRGVLEVLSGWRSASQLVPHTSPEIAADLLTRRRPRVAGRPPTVANVRSLRVSDDVVEVCAVIRRARRCGALAMRFEHGRRGWLLTRLEVG